MDAVFTYASGLSGVSSDQLKLIFCLLVAYPLGSIFVRIPDAQPNLKHLFNISISAFFLLSVLHLWSGVVHLLATSAFTYPVSFYIRTPQMPWIVFFVVMGHLTFNHIARAINNVGYETVEITGAQMVLTMKLTTFAWNVYDGRQPVADLDASQLSTRITKFPSILAFLGYVFYFPGILVGPSCEYAAYDGLVTGKIFDVPVTPPATPANGTTSLPGTNKIANGTATAKKARRVPEGRKRVAYTKLLTGLLFLGLFAVRGTSLDYDRVFDDWYRAQPFWYRIGYVQLLGLAQRTKYYGVWLLTEGASILTGLGFNGYTATGATKWDRTANVDILNIEFAPNFKVLLDSWNMNTNVWLRNCVYKRVTPKGKKPGFRSAMITFLTSAFWHGIYVGYYLSFFLGGFIQHAAKLARTYIRPFVLPAPGASPSISKRLYDVGGIILSVAMLNYAVAPFQLLDLRRSLSAWHAMSWYGHVIIGLPLVFFMNGGARWTRGVAEKRGVVIAGKKKGDGKEKPLVVPPIEGAVNEASKGVDAVLAGVKKVQ